MKNSMVPVYPFIHELYAEILSAFENKKTASDSNGTQAEMQVVESEALLFPSVPQELPVADATQVYTHSDRQDDRRNDSCKFLCSTLDC